MIDIKEILEMTFPANICFGRIIVEIQHNGSSNFYEHRGTASK